MTYESIEVDLTEDEQLRLICASFGIKDDLLEDIKSIESDHEKRIVKLVLSEAVARCLIAAIEAEEKLEDDKQRNR